MPETSYALIKDPIKRQLCKCTDICKMAEQYRNDQETVGMLRQAAEDRMKRLREIIAGDLQHKAPFLPWGAVSFSHELLRSAPIAWKKRLPLRVPYYAEETNETALWLAQAALDVLQNAAPASGRAICINCGDSQGSSLKTLLPEGTIHPTTFAEAEQALGQAGSGALVLVQQAHVLLGDCGGKWVERFNELADAGACIFLTVPARNMQQAIPVLQEMDAVPWAQLPPYLEKLRQEYPIPELGWQYGHDSAQRLRTCLAQFNKPLPQPVPIPQPASEPASPPPLTSSSQELASSPTLGSRRRRRLAEIDDEEQAPAPVVPVPEAQVADCTPEQPRRRRRRPSDSPFD